MQQAKRQALQHTRKASFTKNLARVSLAPSD
jgi:hypothetical protein